MDSGLARRTNDDHTFAVKCISPRLAEARHVLGIGIAHGGNFTGAAERKRDGNDGIRHRPALFVDNLHHYVAEVVAARFQVRPIGQ